MIQAFAQEAAADGAAFAVVHLPTPPDLDLRRRLGRWPYQAFLDGLDRSTAGGPPRGGPDRPGPAREGMDAVYRGHFTAAGNRIVAAAVQRALLAAVGAASPAPSE